MKKKKFGAICVTYAHMYLTKSKGKLEPQKPQKRQKHEIQTT